jgi:hypothetical protein
MTTEEKLALALEALAFYASPKAWERPVNEFSGGFYDSEAMKDQGTKASEALNLIIDPEEA